MNSKQGPRVAGMRTAANAVSRRHNKASTRNNLTEAEA